MASLLDYLGVINQVQPGMNNYIQPIEEQQEPAANPLAEIINQAAASKLPMKVSVTQQEKTSERSPSKLDMLQEEFTKKQMEGLENQKRGVSSLEQQYQDMQGGGPSKLALILAGLSDTVANTKNLPTLLQSQQAQKQQMLQFAQKLQDAKNDVSGQELGIYKARLNAEMDKQKMEQDEILKKYVISAQQAMNREKLNAKGDDLKTLTAAETEQLADIKDQLGSIDNIYADWKDKLGGVRPGVAGAADYVMNTAAGYLPNTETAAYKDNLKQKAQLIGKALEGGKLTDVDYTKYIQFLPQPGDTEDRARQRIENLRNALIKKYQQRVSTFGEAGYKTKGFTGIDTEVKQSSSKRTKNLEDMSEQELEAHINSLKGK